MATALQEFLITLKEKVNIVDVAGGYLSLERRGNGHWACCPFHHEKTPSFCINEADQYYHCFGCGESGDVIKFARTGKYRFHGRRQNACGAGGASNSAIGLR